VTFHAYPGVDFAPKGRSTIQAGDGVYEETWLSPEQWRREINFVAYHAVEIRANGERKFQASSDYEPSRVLMLLRGLLCPIPRYLLEPEIQESHIHWKTEHLNTGNLQWVRISFTEDHGKFGTETRAYDFLPNGILFRWEEQHTALLTSWEDEEPFAGRLVPRHMTVRGAGMDNDMVSADVSIESAQGIDPKMFEIASDPAAPGMTLRPFEEYEISISVPTHIENPGAYQSNNAAPVGVRTSAIAVVDRQGMPREVEVGGYLVYGQTPTKAQMADIVKGTELIVRSIWMDRFHPALIDGYPCEYVWGVSLYYGSDVDMNK
jgi:hypothetical protein